MVKGWSLRRDLDSSFSPSLWPVVRGLGHRSYVDTRLFFERTYMTRGLSQALSWLASRMEGKGGPPGLLLYSPSGWGKTHTLIALYHLASNPKASLEDSRVEAALAYSNTPRPEGAARIVVLDAVSVGPEDLRSMGWRSAWDYILSSLTDGKVRSSGGPPGGESLGEALDIAEEEGGSAVLLFDGVDIYVSRLRSAGSQDAVRELEGVYAFMESLGEALTSRTRSIAVFTVSTGMMTVGPESSVMPALRWARPLAPTSPSEVPEIVRRALFKDIRPEAASTAASMYLEEYRRSSISPPQDYPKRMESLYPLHPQLADILERITAESSLSWTLSLMAEVASNVGEGLDYILPSDIDVSNPRVADRLLSISPRLRTAVAADTSSILRHGSELALKVYSAITLASITGSGISTREVLLSTITPLRGHTRNDVEDALKIIEDTAMYVHVESSGKDKMYHVKSEVNAYLLARRKAREILSTRRGEAASLVAERVKAIIKAPPTLKVVLWPREPQAVPDTPELKLVLANPSYSEDLEFDRYARSIFETYRGGGWRRHVNTIILLKPEKRVYERLLEAAALYIASRELLSSPNVGGEARSKLREVEEAASIILARDSASLYYEAWYPVERSNGGIKLASAPLSPAGEGGLWAVVRYKLAERGKLLRQPPPRLVEEAVKTLASREPVHFSKILEYFTANPSMPMIEAGEQGLENVLKALLASGVVGVVSQGRTYCSPPPGGIKALKFALCLPGREEEVLEEAKKAREGEGKGIVIEASPEAVIAALSVIPGRVKVRVLAWGYAGSESPSGKLMVSFDGEALWALKILEDLELKGLVSRVSLTIADGNRTVTGKALEAARSIDPEARAERTI
ncbi:MAG: ATP-binding protein [Desulfurococcales archaeon]|nr:ATP-binding protein [Desulfurococcales archaeon]